MVDIHATGFRPLPELSTHCSLCRYTCDNAAQPLCAMGKCVRVSECVCVLEVGGGTCVFVVRVRVSVFVCWTGSNRVALFFYEG